MNMRAVAMPYLVFCIEPELLQPQCQKANKKADYCEELSQKMGRDRYDNLLLGRWCILDLTLTQPTLPRHTMSELCHGQAP